MDDLQAPFKSHRDRYYEVHQRTIAASKLTNRSGECLPMDRYCEMGRMTAY